MEQQRFFKLKLDVKSKLLIALVFMALGFMLSVQYRATEQQKSIRLQRIEDLSERLKQVEGEKEQLSRQVAALQRESGAAQVMAQEVERLGILAGTAAVEGPGLEVVLDDSQLAAKARENPNLYIIHDEDLLRLLNELRAAGAEALSLNGQRIVATSEVRCAGPTVSVNNVRSAPPYSIKAIGDTKTLNSALRLRGGVVETFEFWGIQVKINTWEKLSIPAYRGAQSFDYARVAPAKGKEAKP